MPKKEKTAPKKEKTAYEGNATRTVTKCRMDLVPACGLLRIGDRYGLGVSTHGESNWKSGGKDFIKATINHLEIHVQELKERGNSADDNLGAIGWAATALAWFEVNKPGEWDKAMKEIS